MFRPEFEENENRVQTYYLNQLDINQQTYMNDKEIAMAQHPQLRTELENTLKEINTSLEYVKHLAQHRDVPAETMQYPNGQYIMFGLLAAKAQVLSSLAHIG